MTDYISRKEVLDYLQVIPIDSGYREIIDVEEFVKKLHAADVAEVRHGEWIAGTDGMLHCSNCYKIPANRIIINGLLVNDMSPIRTTMHYCPKCGSRMDGGDHDAAD